MAKRLLSLVMALAMLCLCVPSLGESLTGTVFDAADEAGTVVNASKPTSEATAFSPIDAVLVLDASGSMERSNPSNGKSVLSYAQDAAQAFCNTLFAISPQSRVAVVAYDGNVYTICDLTDQSGHQRLLSSIRGISTGGMTNTGGGYARALELLTRDSREGVPHVVLMLSDGLANEGASDPMAYAIQQGQRCAQDGLVYTIGLVGGMSGDEKRATRYVLNDAYATRYFEVGFDGVEDISAELLKWFVIIASCSSSADEAGAFYCFSVGSAMDVRVENENGEILSSSAEDLKTSASYGSLSFVGDAMDEKLLILTDGTYSIRLHGTDTRQSYYRLVRFSGRRASESVLLDSKDYAHPALCKIITIKDGVVTEEDVSYNPLDPDATDPFTGERSKGLQIPAVSRLSKSAALRSLPQKDAKQIKAAFDASASVDVYASAAGYTLIGAVTTDGAPFRAWVETSGLTVEGYVPEMFFLSGEYTVREDVLARYAPLDTALEAVTVKAGTQAALLYAERDHLNTEWVYVSLPEKKPHGVYLPASCLEGWQTRTPDRFRMGYQAAAVIWQRVLGNGYTEFMWAAPQKDGSGTVLSGRSSATSGVLKARYGDRDAFALLVSPAGEVEKSVSTGGAGLDSFHCIVPTQGGYLVSGVTRSNNKQFEDIWAPESHSGKRQNTFKRTNALIGMLDEELAPVWLKSFGTPDDSYGFDMVIELADGSIVGAGWMSGSSGTVPCAGGQDFYVVKLSRAGEVLAMRSYGTTYNDVPDSAWPTPDGGLMIVGSRTFSDKTHDGLILVLDSNLNVVNECVYGGRGDDVFDNVRPLSDGTYLVTGFSDSPSGNGVGVGRGGHDFWAINIDSMGRSIWSKRYGGSRDEELRGTSILPDGTVVMVGSTFSNDGDVRGARTGSDENAWVIGIDQNGRLLWQYTFGTAKTDYFNGAALDPADGCIVLDGLCHGDKSNAKGLYVKIAVMHMKQREQAVELIH